MARVFLVDDDVDLVEVNKLVLEEKGHEVLVAYSGAEASGMIDGAKPDVAVLDVMMENDTAGFQLAREIHARYPKLPMLMLTGIRQAKGVTFTFEPDDTWLPVVRFMEKPIDPDELVAEIAAVLK